MKHAQDTGGSKPLVTPDERIELRFIELMRMGHLAHDPNGFHRQFVSLQELLELIGELGGAASYLSQAEMVLQPGHDWVKQAEAARKAMAQFGPSER